MGRVIGSENVHLLNEPGTNWIVRGTVILEKALAKAPTARLEAFAARSSGEPSPFLPKKPRHRPALDGLKHSGGFVAQ